MKKRRFFRRALAIAVLTTLASANAFGLSTKYFKTVAQSNTGEGTVYASMDYKKPADSGFSTESSTDTEKDSVSYVFAKPATGYGFKEWQLVSGDLAQSSFDLAANPMMVVNNGSSTSSENPATITLKAVFVQTAVSVISDNEEFGTVSIDKPANSENESVTLTAKPDSTTFKFSEFDGWYLNGDKKSSSKVYTFTINSNNKGVYVAKFTRKAGYFRLKSQVANKYTYVFGDSARQSNSSTEGFSGIVFDGSIAMVPAANLDLTDPGYIVKIDGVTDLKNGGLKDLDFTCQGVNARDMITDKYPTAIVNARAAGDYWTFYYNYGGNDRYLKDGTYYPINYAIACGGASDHQWTLEPVDNTTNTNYFGVVGDIHDADNGVYYIPLYTSFPYQCPTGMKAFFLDEDFEKHYISGTTIQIPANTPIILESSYSTAAQNKLMPLFDDPTISVQDGYSIENSILDGYCLSSVTEIDTDDILVLVEDEDLGIFVAEYDGENLNNKAFVNQAKMTSEARRALNGNATGIKELEHQQQNSVVYDMTGRKVSNLNASKHGLYIVNGKKTVLK